MLVQARFFLGKESQKKVRLELQSSAGKDKTFSLNQRSPTFLAPGASFVEDNFSTDRWGPGKGGGGGRGAGGEGAGMVQKVMRALGAMGSVKLCSLAHHSPPAVRPSS